MSNDYSRRVHLAQAFIRRHCEDDIKLDDLAQAAHLSPYHFHRIFTRHTSETPNDYLRRIRVSDVYASAEKTKTEIGGSMKTSAKNTVLFLGLVLVSFNAQASHTNQKTKPHRDYCRVSCEQPIFPVVIAIALDRFVAHHAQSRVLVERLIIKIGLAIYGGEYV